MEQVTFKLGGYFLALLLAYGMKRAGILKKEDSGAVTRIILNVTLPATAVGAFASLSRDFSYLLLVAAGFTASFVPWIAAAAASRKKDAATRALYLCNCPTLNLGAFAMPFLQIMLPPSAVAAVCLFDIGNAIVIHGTVLPLSASFLKTGSRGKGAAATLREVFRSVAFCAYILMLALFLLNIQFPDVVYSVLENFSAPNGFLVMFNLGLLLEFSFNWKQLKNVLGIAAIRLANSAVFAAAFFFLLPFDSVIRKGMVMAVFAPTAAICPFMTGECGGDESLSSFCVTVCEIISAAALVILLYIL